MKILLLVVAFLLVLTSARVTQPWVGDYNVSIAADRPLYLPFPAASDDLWNTCKCRGENFWKAMHSSKEDAGKLFRPVRDSSESTFTDTAALTTWSWKDAAVPANSYEFDKAWGVDHVLRAIGVSDKATKKGGSIQVVKVTHGDGDANGGGFGPSPYNSQPEYTVNGKNYRVTGSEYTFGFDPSGVLLAMDRKSPQFAGSQRNPKVQGDDLPDLQSFSDVAWLKWKAVTGNTPSTMRYFASLSISNIDTRGVLSRVLSKAGFTEIPAWPGHDVDASTEEGAALLGSPNALAFSYFLVQHKTSLGHLKISKITLFKNSMNFADPSTIKITGVVVLAFVASSQANRLSDYFANHTFAAFSAAKNVTTFEGGLPPPVPARSAPKPPGEPNLSLYASASDDVWESAKCKGANFVRAMRGSDREAGQVFKPPRESAASEFENVKYWDAQKWGWDLSLNLHLGDFKAWGVDSTLRDLGVSDKCETDGGEIDCLTFVHGFEGYDKDGIEFPVDDSTYRVDGKTYRRTGAHYGLGFEARKGVIIAMDRNSPQSAGKKRKPAVEGDELPAIGASSDIAWLAWRMFGTEAGNVKNLNYFLSLSITNEETRAIISRAIRDTIPEAQSFPAWGGYDFDTSTPEGQAILGTPNAQAFSYLLLQHKATLGNLYISQVRVFRDTQRIPKPVLLLVVEPSPANDEPATSDDDPIVDIPSLFAKFGRREGAADRINIAAKSLEDLPAPAPLAIQPKPVPGQDEGYLNLYQNAEDAEWENAKCKGANFVRAMRGSDSEAAKIFKPPRDSAAGLYDETHLDDLTTWGWSGKEATEPGMKYYGVDHVLRDMGSSDTLYNKGGDIRLVSFVHGTPKQGENGEWVTIDQQHYEVDGKRYRYTGAWYNFALDEINGVMIATDRMSPQEAGSKLLPVIEGDDLPLIRAFSDMAWISWKTLADQAETDPKNIHYFMSLSITNELTQRILSRCVREVLPGAWGFPDWPGFEFDASTPQGQAILGTPNAQAFSYFLLQHKKELGNLYISRVRVFHDSNWLSHANLLMIVEPVPADNGEEPEKMTPTPEAGSQERRISTSHRLRLWWNRAKL